jgi:hypothetical protein
MTRNKNDFAYLAGLLDTGRGEIKESGLISIAADDKAFAKFLVSNFGGSISSEHQWQSELGKHTEKILLAVIPYMILNHESAKKSLEYVRRGIPRG